MREQKPDEPGSDKPIKLKPPQQKAPQIPKKRFAAPVVLILFILTIIGTGYFIVILPVLLKAPPSITETPDVEKSVPSPPVPTATKAEENKNNTAETEQALNHLLLKKNQAESENISGWAPEQYKTVLNIEQRGDQLFKKHNYKKSTALYQNATNELNHILQLKQQIYVTSIKNGLSALAEGASKDAHLNFARALAINPESSEASTGLQRSKTIEEVIQLHEQALLLEKSGKLDDASFLLKKLLTIDSAYLLGKQSLDRVSEVIKRQRFNSEMGLFLTSLETDDLDTTQSSLKKLLAIQKGHPDVIRAQKMFIARKESARIEVLLKTAEELCQNEQWDDALSTYRQVTAIAPESLFAVNGINNALKRKELDQTLTEVIGRPDQLQDIAQRGKVEKIIKYARTVRPQGHRLSTQITRLQDLVEIAATPISVIIDSDNMTDISIYHVGKIGHFHSQEIPLTPGTYTIVGSRPGFQDVRVTIQVDPKKTTNRFRIQCKVSI